MPNKRRIILKKVINMEENQDKLTDDSACEQETGRDKETGRKPWANPSLKSIDVKETAGGQTMTLGFEDESSHS